ncbi:hypothetical protein GBA52_003234 [Prunus armeniaca]|nr:hypothetical protein GBA52_003234 [Prunus armeniaca]
MGKSAMSGQKQAPNTVTTPNPKQCLKDRVQCKVKNSGNDHLEQGLARLNETNLLIALGAMLLYDATGLETNLAQPTNNRGWALSCPI